MIEFLLDNEGGFWYLTTNLSDPNPKVFDALTSEGQWSGGGERQTRRPRLRYRVSSWSTDLVLSTAPISPITVSSSCIFVWVWLKPLLQRGFVQILFPSSILLTFCNKVCIKRIGALNRSLWVESIQMPWLFCHWSATYLPSHSFPLFAPEADRIISEKVPLHCWSSNHRLSKCSSPSRNLLPHIFSK